MKHRRLTEQEWREILSALTPEEAAKKTGYNWNYIYRKAKTYGITVKKRNRTSYPVPADEYKEFLSGHTVEEASSCFGIHKSTVRGHCKKLSVRPKPGYKRALINGERNRMMKVLARTFTYESIGKVFGMSRQAVFAIVQRERNAEQVQEQKDGC